jgi:hypothetical protein
MAESHWRILPPHVIDSDQDVIPEEIMDTALGGYWFIYIYIIKIEFSSLSSPCLS